MTKIAVLFFGVVFLSMATEIFSTEGDICPGCICPVERSPVCGKQVSTGILRGFASMCVLECSNKCRKNKFEFYKRGRCGKPKKPRQQYPTVRVENDVLKPGRYVRAVKPSIFLKHLID